MFCFGVVAVAKRVLPLLFSVKRSGVSFFTAQRGLSEVVLYTAVMGSSAQEASTDLRSNQPLRHQLQSWRLDTR